MFKTEQVAEIWIPASAKGKKDGSCGTGYLLFNHCILTAFHVVQGCGARTIHARLLGNYENNREDWPPAHILWKSQKLDLAILRYAGEYTGEVVVPCVKALNLQEKHTCRVYGFPRFNTLPPHSDDSDDLKMDDSDGAVDLEVLEGWIKPVDSPKSPGRLFIENEGTSPGSMEGWKGISGGPVFTDECLVGVVLQGLKELKGERLEAIALESSIQELNDALKEHFEQEVCFQEIEQSIDTTNNFQEIDLDELANAFVRAFLNIEDIERMMKYKMKGRPILRNEISTHGGKRDVIFRLLEWAEVKNQLIDLIEAALKYNPNHPDLRKIANRLDMS